MGQQQCVICVICVIIVFLRRCHPHSTTSERRTRSRSPIPPFIHHIGVAADSHLKSEEKRDDDDGDDGGEEGGLPRRTEAETNPHS